MRNLDLTGCTWIASTIRLCAKSLFAAKWRHSKILHSLIKFSIEASVGDFITSSIRWTMRWRPSDSTFFLITKKRSPPWTRQVSMASWTASSGDISENGIFNHLSHTSPNRIISQKWLTTKLLEFEILNDNLNSSKFGISKAICKYISSHEFYRKNINDNFRNFS